MKNCYKYSYFNRPDTGFSQFLRLTPSPCRTFSDSDSYSLSVFYYHPLHGTNTEARRPTDTDSSDCRTSRTGSTDNPLDASHVVSPARDPPDGGPKKFVIFLPFCLEKKKLSLSLHPLTETRLATTTDGAIAQMVEQRTENPCVPGSIPGGTTFTKRKIMKTAEIQTFQRFFLYVLPAKTCNLVQ